MEPPPPPSSRPGTAASQRSKNEVPRATLLAYIDKANATIVSAM